MFEPVGKWLLALIRQYALRSPGNPHPTGRREVNVPLRPVPFPVAHDPFPHVTNKHQEAPQGETRRR